MTDLLEIENEYYKSGIKVLCGVDEAGRGPLAGPVCAAAVILPPGHLLEGVNDSKKLTERARDALYDVIINEAVAYGIAFAEIGEIESMNILNASLLAMRRAVDMLSPRPGLVLVDGNNAGSFDIPSEAIIKGDGRCISIAAASILAKVTRDRYMLQMDEVYPEYGFARHKGYGTKLHYEMLDKYGPCPIHRLSFLKKRYPNATE